MSRKPKIEKVEWQEMAAVGDMRKALTDLEAKLAVLTLRVDDLNATSNHISKSRSIMGTQIRNLSSAVSKLRDDWTRWAGAFPPDLLRGYPTPKPPNQVKAEQELANLRSQLGLCREDLSDALQSDCEQGAAWLNDLHTANLSKQYPALAAWLSRFCEFIDEELED